MGGGREAEEMHLLGTDTKHQLIQWKPLKQIHVKRNKLLKMKEFCLTKGCQVLLKRDEAIEKEPSANAPNQNRWNKRRKYLNTLSKKLAHE